MGIVGSSAQHRVERQPQEKSTSGEIHAAACIGQLTNRRLSQELVFTVSLADLAKKISEISRVAPMTIAVSATLNAGQ